MKFNVPSRLLLNRLGGVSKAIGASKNAYAILDNFLFVLEGDNLVITGSDLETRLTTTIPVSEAEGAGQVALDVRRMLSILKELPDTALSFDINDENHNVHITYPNGEFNIAGLDGADYPAKQLATGLKTFSLPEKSIVAGLQHTIFAVGNDKTHVMFMGVYWDIMPDMIVFVATDSHILVRFKQMNVAPGFESSFIMPTKPAQILLSLLDKNGEAPVSIQLEEKSATFEAEDYTLSCRFHNGRYPRYNSVIPEDVPYIVSVDRMSLLNALRRVSVLASAGGLIQMEIKADEINLTAQDLDHATAAAESVPCQYTGEPMTMGFNNENVIDVLSNLESEMVFIKLIDPARAGIFLPAEQQQGEDLLILQMPMMV